ncbi:MFS transporter [Paenibacillus polysaccharolyticus]|uniref:MFS transporter n=1 Tax=Paenibacillus polysaccharolyticus TaxID=582692 RepID=UPI0020A1F6A7|nr:MFS transporter [Paenibacillus polysaccharolyticus]MCP1132485.1 MFS transporter [Paenibacillus polysaccharolyticus]
MNTLTSDISPQKLWGKSFIFIMLANALLFMAFEMLLPTLPLFVSSLGGNASKIGLVTGIFMFSAILVRPFTSVLATKMDKKHLLIIGIAICALATGAYYLSSGIGIILVLRVIHGFGFGLATTYFTTIATENIPKSRRGEGMGYFGVGETVAISVGPLIGTSLLLRYNYQSLFLGGMCILLLALLMTVFVSRNSRRESEDKSSVHLATSVKLIEKKVLFPSLLILMVGVAAGSIMSFVALFAAEKGFSNIAWFFFIVAIASFVVRLFSGTMFDRLGPGSVLLPSAFFAIAGLLVLILSQNQIHFLIAGALYGFGFGAIFPAIQTWCVNLVEEHEHESAMASFFNFFDLGIGGGSLVLGLVASAFSYTVVYTISIAVLVIYILLYSVYALKQKQFEDRSLGVHIE